MRKKVLIKRKLKLKKQIEMKIEMKKRKRVKTAFREKNWILKFTLKFNIMILML